MPFLFRLFCDAVLNTEACSLRRPIRRVPVHGHIGHERGSVLRQAHPLPHASQTSSTGTHAYPLPHASQTSSTGNLTYPIPHAS